MRGLLEFARRRQPELESVDLSAVLAEAIEFLEADLAAAAVRLEWRRPEPIWVRGERSLLLQVFINLLVNALQAVEHKSADRWIEVAQKVGADSVSVSVRDSGPGISADALPRVLDPFFTTRANGTGLGLAVARNIVQQLGGTLEPGNAASGGAVFQVTLPLVERSEPARV